MHCWEANKHPYQTQIISLYLGPTIQNNLRDESVKRRSQNPSKSHLALLPPTPLLCTNGARPRLPAAPGHPPRRVPVPARARAGALLGRLRAAAGHQLRPRGEQPPAAAGGPAPPPQPRHWPRAPLRPRHRHAAHLRQDRDRALRRRPRPGPRHGHRPRGLHVLAQDQHPALPPGHQDRRAHRRQRGAHGQQHGAHPQPAPGDAVPARRARRGQPREADRRHDRAQPRRPRHLLPALGGGLPQGSPPVPLPHPRLPRQDRLAIPRERIPLLRLLRRPQGHPSRVRSSRAELRRRPGCQHRPPLPQPPRRPDRRRLPRHRGGQQRRCAGGRDTGLRVGVALRRGRQREGRDAAERGEVQQQPDAAGGGVEGHAAQAQRAAARVSVRALQREHQARAGVRAQLRPVQARQHAGVPALLQPSARRWRWRRIQRHRRRQRLLRHLVWVAGASGSVVDMGASCCGWRCRCPHSWSLRYRDHRLCHYLVLIAEIHSRGR